MTTKSAVLNIGTAEEKNKHLWSYFSRLQASILQTQLWSCIDHIETILKRAIVYSFVSWGGGGGGGSAQLGGSFPLQNSEAFRVGQRDAGGESTIILIQGKLALLQSVGWQNPGSFSIITCLWTSITFHNIVLVHRLNNIQKEMGGAVKILERQRREGKFSYQAITLFSILFLQFLCLTITFIPFKQP